jgi:hypothetical protein
MSYILLMNSEFDKSLDELKEIFINPESLEEFV